MVNRSMVCVDLAFPHLSIKQIPLADASSALSDHPDELPYRLIDKTASVESPDKEAYRDNRT